MPDQKEKAQKSLQQFYNDLNESPSDRIQFVKDIFGPPLGFLSDAGAKLSLMYARTTLVASMGSALACLAFISNNPIPETPLDHAIRLSFGLSVISTIVLFIAGYLQNRLIGSILGSTTLLSIEILTLDNKENAKNQLLKIRDQTKYFALIDKLTYVAFSLLVFATYKIWVSL